MDFNWQQVFSGYGVFLTVGALVVVFKAVIGPYWTDLVNRASTIVLACGLAIAGTLAYGAIENLVVPWYTILGSGINGIIVAGSLLGVNAVYRSRIAADTTGVTWKSPL